MKIGSLVRYQSFAHVADGHDCLKAFFIVVEVDEKRPNWVRIQSIRDIDFCLSERISCLEVICEGG